MSTAPIHIAITDKLPKVLQLKTVLKYVVRFVVAKLGIKKRL